MVGKLERNKDLIQDVVENTARGVGSITSIITGAVADVTREIGDIVTDGFEMREAAKAAGRAERAGAAGLDAGEAADTELDAAPEPEPAPELELEAAPTEWELEPAPGDDSAAG
ncbi:MULTISPECIES: hypothetical protein [unclassified Gordonia (in: high G+C Gram-positive bacteria)]|uniref:hypothetical protein n=1 Tax=unclassified Gordonia (in: high G+C Gram-positive bacteria) TaxID=2657482 RepID=UPI0020005AE6|nr:MULTISPECIES: hypothetical protein [unclassified Gordonia (in: high G+C Gram-positive bacteria)]UQE75999.1 hypothetical protein MYK68_05215 [Gordonia sp. PP30]